MPLENSHDSLFNDFQKDYKGLKSKLEAIENKWCAKNIRVVCVLDSENYIVNLRKNTTGFQRCWRPFVSLLLLICLTSAR